MVGMGTTVFADGGESILAEEMDQSIYQMVSDYESGRYISRIEDKNFNPEALFSEDKSVDMRVNNIYDVYQTSQEGIYCATKISIFSNLEKEEQGTANECVIMCRVVYQTVNIADGFTGYNIITVKGGVVKTTNSYIVDALYLKSTGSGLAYNSAGTYIGYKSEGKSYTRVPSYPVTGTSYSISSGLSYYYSPDVGGGGTAGFCKGIVSAAHWADSQDLEVGCGWV